MDMAAERAAVLRNLAEVARRVTDAYASAAPETRWPITPRLLTVSKTFPAAKIRYCYEAGYRHFGESYLHELQAKAHELATSCTEIRWHFIGRLQSNKIRKICAVPGLWCVETVESIKHCETLQHACSDLGITLRVFVQVNTSAEPNKGGVELVPEEGENVREGSDQFARLLDVVAHLRDECPNLRFIGLMTIGSIQQSSCNDGHNADFDRLREARRAVCQRLSIEPQAVELSMGMSGDFETAIRHFGSAEVRVGSLIFGQRDYGDMKS